MLQYIIAETTYDAFIVCSFINNNACPGRGNVFASPAIRGKSYASEFALLCAAAATGASLACVLSIASPTNDGKL